MLSEHEEQEVVVVVEHSEPSGKKASHEGKTSAASRKSTELRPATSGDEGLSDEIVTGQMWHFP